MFGTCPKGSVVITWNIVEITLTEEYPKELNTDEENDTENDISLGSCAHVGD